MVEQTQHSSMTSQDSFLSVQTLSIFLTYWLEIFVIHFFTKYVKLRSLYVSYVTWLAGKVLSLKL